MSYWPKELFLTCFLKSAADSTFLILFGISFHTLAPLYEKLVLVISILGRGICRSFALLVSYFETWDLFMNFCLRISGHCSFRILCTIIAWSSLISSFTLSVADGILSLIGADWIRVIALFCNLCKLLSLVAER